MQNENQVFDSIVQQLEDHLFIQQKKLEIVSLKFLILSDFLEVTMKKKRYETLMHNISKRAKALHMSNFDINTKICNFKE